MEQKDSIKEGVRDAILHFWTTEGFRRLDMAVEGYWAKKRDRSTNPLLKKGEKYFSQNDEDGILLEICRRMNIGVSNFVEMGVGNGLENNSLILLMHGWQGTWIGGEDLAFQVPEDCRLSFTKAWVTRDNCATLVRKALATRLGADGIPSKDLGVLSIDLDGNDLYVLEALLATGLRPRIVVAEYNGKFPPPVRWSVAYDPELQWTGDDYQGASLQSFADLLGPAGYRLLGCNITGANAFFADGSCIPAGAFDDVPDSISEVFMAADYNWFVRRGHMTSPRTILRCLSLSP